MRISITLLLLCFIIISIFHYSSCTASPFTSSEKQAIVSAHNQKRAGVNPSAQNMKTMVWDAALASSAQAYANKCISTAGTLMDHNADRSKGFSYYVGENIYATQASVANGVDAVNLWYNEVTDYNYDTNTCAQGKICGHYTQLVWATSNKVGCGRASCPNIKYPNTIVCDYGPGGNTNGAKPYIAGSPVAESQETNTSFASSTVTIHVMCILLVVFIVFI
jgi:uncharacterized protein YkwD